MKWIRFGFSWSMLVLILLLSERGRAALVIDPYVGYVGGNASGTLQDGVTSFKGTFSGSGYGARLTLSFSKIFFGLDYSVDTLNYSAGDTNTSNNTTTFSTAYGVLGFHFDGIRIYAGYGFSDTEAQTSGGMTETFTGTAAKVGLGIRLAQHISLNLEYVTHSPAGVTPPGGASGPLSSSFNALTNTTYFVGLSFPFWF